MVASSATHFEDKSKRKVCDLIPLADARVLASHRHLFLCVATAKKSVTESRVLSLKFSDPQTLH